MENAGTILSVGMLIAILASMIIGSYKSGFIAYSGQSLTDGNKPKFGVDKTKVQPFIIALFITFVINAAFALVIAEGEVMVSVFFGFFNTLVLSYALAYWILLKEKKIAPNRRDHDSES